MTTFLQFDFVPILVGLLVTAATAPLGAYLLLRREAMFADAVGHAVLPGFVLAFAVAGSASLLASGLGALVSALAAALVVRLLERGARLDRSAALGVTFTTFFALGILLLERTGASGTTFDIHTVLFGNLETLTWLDATGPASLLDPAALAYLPEILADAFGVAVLTGLCLTIGRKELALASFDPVFAEVSGEPARAVTLAFAALAALAAVVSFRAFGLIPTLALFVCPAAAARMVCNRLVPLLFVAAGCGFLAVGIGYVAASFGPGLFGSERALNAAGAIAVAAGVIQVVTMVASPRRMRAV